MSEANITVSDLEIMSNAHNYRRWMFRQIAPYVGQRILEVGAGIGNFTALFLDRQLIVPTDTYEPCVEYLQTRLGQRLDVPPMLLDVMDPAMLELREHAFDTIVCLNVLEHVADDRLGLRHMYDVLQPGGRLVLLVPAFPFLYGTVDRSLDHYRRYTRPDLTSKLRDAGFQIEKTFYMNIIGMAGWFLNNRILKRSEESGDQIVFFDRFIAPWAERIEQVIQPPVGLSLIAIARKSEQA
jgi:2-polyprenyl-3-methyl-5-hydroxy-6-metoxy-1,4-benzoquinol methylase